MNEQLSEIVPANLSDGDGRVVSVIIAAWPDLDGLDQCLDALASQQNVATEIFVVVGTPAPAETRARFPWARWLQGSAEMLVPHLWSVGITASDGKIVAITTSRFVPALDWLKNIREAHQRLASAGIGGAIDPPSGGSPKAWAIYFLRYSAYLNYTEEQIVNEIAGENASYKRGALNAHGEAIGNEFWEPEFHRLLRAEGKTLTFVPSIRITQGVAFGFRIFCRQRFQHGRHFGFTRLQGRSSLERLARLVTWPLIPAVLLAKIFRRVAANGRFLGQFLFSLPLLLAFVVAWTLGELFGYCMIGSPTLPMKSPQKI